MDGAGEEGVVGSWGGGKGNCGQDYYMGEEFLFNNKNDFNLEAFKSH